MDMKIKTTIKTVAMVLLMAIITSTVAMAQMVVSDPAMLNSITMYKYDSKMRSIELKSQIAQSIATAGQTLSNIKTLVANIDTVYNNQIKPLKDDYDFMKGFVDNVQFSNLWGVGEHMLGESLDPLEYMPGTMKNPEISRYMNKNLGWSSQDVDGWNNKSGYNDFDSRYSKRVYRALLPSRDDIDFQLMLENPDMVWNNPGVLQQRLAYLDELTGITPDSVALMGLLEQIDLYRLKANNLQKEIDKVQKEMDLRLEKGNTLSPETHGYYTELLQDAYMSLDEALAQIDHFTGELAELQKENARGHLEELRDRALIKGFEALGDESRRMNNSGNREMAGKLFGD